MIIYKDVFTGDELLSDGFKIVEKDDFVYEVDGKVRVKRGWVEFHDRRSILTWRPIFSRAIYFFRTS